MDNDKPKFIRAEYFPEKCWDKVIFHWECNICGCEYTTTTANSEIGLCRACRTKLESEKAKQRRKKSLQVGYKSAIAKLKKSFSLSAIPSVNIDGKTYLERKAIIKALNDFLENEANEEERKGDAE